MNPIIPEIVGINVTPENRMVVITGGSEFPKKTSGQWNGNVYHITVNGHDFYDSNEVPDDIKRQLGRGNIEIENRFLRIRFDTAVENMRGYF